VTRRRLRGVVRAVRLVFLIPLALLAAACGSVHVSQRGPAPKAGPHSPPPAWIETKAGSRWLGFSSYCWNDPSGRVGVCADMIAPECNRRGTPDIDVENGESVRAHLGYAPDEASVKGANAKLDGRLVTWRIERAGPFSLFTRAAGKDASYVGCAVLR
jgi:hypothetical protein